MSEEMDALAQKGRGLGRLRQILQKQGGIERVMGVRDNDGELQKDPGKITEVFAKFYEDLYTETHAGDDYPLQDAPRANPVTVEEVVQALRQLKNGKTGADDGLVAEMLKTGHDELVKSIATFLEGILQDDLEVPDSWRKTELKVIFKKGD
jgi:hypothetical protein